MRLFINITTTVAAVALGVAAIIGAARVELGYQIWEQEMRIEAAAQLGQTDNKVVATDFITNEEVSADLVALQLGPDGVKELKEKRFNADVKYFLLGGLGLALIFAAGIRAIHLWVEEEWAVK